MTPVGGNRIPRANAPLDERPICGAEPSGLKSGVKHNRVCWQPKGHEGLHSNRTGEFWVTIPARQGRTVVSGSYVANVARRAL
jgi:hypothetical protein